MAILTRVPQLSVSFMGCIADEYCLMSTYSKACMYDCKERDEEERERGMKSVHKKISLSKALFQHSHSAGALK